ncbi:MAG: hypothetical protein MJ183_00810 [Treponemataceae bacterium]|nr:hypothetical protein [Treponemataceae bacterium]
MSEIYSSASGSYSSYLSQRQTDEIKQQVQKNANQQMFATAMTGYYLGTKIDSVDQNIVRMSTGIQNSINQNTYTIAASAEMLKETFDAGFDAINNKLDMGFAGVTNAIGAMSASMTAGFNAVSAAIDYWGSKICEKLDAIHDIVNNPLLTASRELYRRAAKNSEKKFYEEALEDIKSAIEKNKTDYISWGLMGKLYLFGISEFSNVVDVPKALEAFKNACKYIGPDIDESEEAKKMAAEFYFYLGYAQYILANERRIAGETTEYRALFEEASSTFGKSYTLSSTMAESLYNKTRCNSLLEKKEVVLEDLRFVIEQDPLYSIKVLSDSDFSGYTNEIINLISEMRDNLASEIQKDIIEFNDFRYTFFGGNFAEWLENQIQYINDNKEKFSGEQKYPYYDTWCFYSILNRVLEITKTKSFVPDCLAAQKKINIEKNCYSTFHKSLDGLFPFAYFSPYDYKESSSMSYWKSRFQFTDENHQAIEWRIMPALKAAINNNFSEDGWIYAGIGYDKTSREIYFGLTFERGNILPSIKLNESEDGDISEFSEYGYDISDFISFSPQKKFWIELEKVPSVEWLQEFILTKKTNWEVSEEDETAIKNGTFTTGRYVICEHGQKSVLDLPDYNKSHGYGYYILDENTIFAVETYGFGLKGSHWIYVFASGVEVASVKEIEEQRKVEEEQRKVEEEQRKVEEQISIEKQKQDAAKAAIKRRNNSIRKKQDVKVGFLWALSILIAALLIKPAGMFGYRIWQKCGAVIFVNLDISFFLIFILRSGHWFRGPIFGEEKEEYLSYPCGPYWLYADDLLNILECTWVSLIPAVFTTALKIGLILGHPIISCLLSVVLWVVIIVVVDSISVSKKIKKA